MKSHVLPLLCIAIACLLATNAQNGAAPAPQKDRSPYVGTYQGTYTSITPGGDQEGEVTLTVDDEGNIKGEAFNKGINQTATLKGSVNKDSKASIAFEFPSLTATAYGTIAKTSTGSFTWTLTQRVGTTAFGSLEFDVKPKSK
jgi:hypothetical protein